MRRLCAGVCGGVTLCLMFSVTAAAQPYLSVGGGLTTSGIANGSRPTYSGAFGVDGDFVGFEGEFGYTVRIANEEGTYGDNVRTVMGQILVGPRIGSIRVFGLAGAGLIGAVGQLKHIFTTDDEQAVNVFGYNFGGGVLIDASDRFAFRIDGKYFRALESDVENSDDKIKFIRVGAALVWRF